MLKISDFYLDKQKSFIPKKYYVYHVPWIALSSANRWRLDILTFLVKGFEHSYTKNPDCSFGQLKKSRSFLVQNSLFLLILITSVKR